MAICRFANVLASIKMARDMSYVDLTAEDFDFLTRDRIWSLAEKKKARRCIDAITFGSLDASGLPSFKVPAEFTAGVIAYFVHPSNMMIACSFMEGATTVDSLATNRKDSVSAEQMFALCIQALEQGGVSPVAERKMEMCKRLFGAAPAEDVSDTE